MSNQDWQEWSSVNSNSSNSWGTPPNLWRPFSDALDGFDLDPCSGAEPQPIATERYTQDDNGLEQSWFGDVWVNPPYSDPSAWWDKAISEYTHGDVDRVVLLLPARTNTNYFVDNIQYTDLVCFVDHKVKFLKEGKPAKDFLPTPVMFLYIGEVTEEIVTVMNQFGWTINVDEDQITLADFGTIQ